LYRKNIGEVKNR